MRTPPAGPDEGRREGAASARQQAKDPGQRLIHEHIVGVDIHLLAHRQEFIELMAKGLPQPDGRIR